MSKRIFISKNASEIEPFRSQLKELGYSIVAHSFLSFSPVEFEIEQPYGVVFFGSPRAVIFFRGGTSISENKLIACVGEKTADLLRTLGYVVSFTGKQSGDPRAVADEFKIWLGDKSVLFPVSDRSLKTISDVIDEGQKDEVVVYATELVGRLIEDCDVYVFTSPSNVEGFFEENVISESSQVVAWGKSTEAALEERGIVAWKVLGKSGFEELVGTLK